ncbi:MAG: hypothetical protein QXQ19_01325 [Candidatus Aenigmatarchaeota archaeon]
MIIWINKPKPFEAAAIVRFLYYSTGLENIDLFLSEIKRIDSFVRYSKVPIEIIKEKIKFDKPEGKFLVIDPKGRSIENYDLKEYSGFVIDFSKTLEGDKVRGIGLDMLHYEAISLFSKLFLKKEKDIANFDISGLEREKIYFAKKILDGIQFVDNYYFISPRLLYFCLKNFEKKFKILVDMENSEIVFKKDRVMEKVYIAFYDNNLNLIERDIIELNDKILKIPIIIGKKKKILEFYIDFDERKVYLNKNFSISKEDTSEIYENFVDFLNF